MLTELIDWLRRQSVPEEVILFVVIASVLLGLVSLLLKLRQDDRLGRLEEELKQRTAALQEQTDRAKTAEEAARKKSEQLETLQASLIKISENVAAQTQRNDEQREQIEAKNAEIERKAGEISRLRASLERPVAEVWAERPTPPQFIQHLTSLHQRRRLIISVINQKGGVGKSTTVANLAAAFVAQRKRVLIVDSDFQGTLTSMFYRCLTEERRALYIEMMGQGSRLDNLLDRQVVAKRIVDVELDVVDAVAPGKHGAGAARLLAADYNLGNSDARAFVQFIFADATFDPRFAMFDALWQDNRIDAYDVILFDLPPRMVSSAVNALCASTHVLVPTIADEISAPSVSFMLRMLRQLRPLNPTLKLLGILPTMTTWPGKLADKEARVLVAVRSHVKELWDAPLVEGKPADYILSSAIPERALFSEAILNKQLPYHYSDEAKAWYDALAAEIEGRR